ncbi:MAG: SAM-dependent methyltransferase, partial [Bacteroidota bacterium]
MQVPFFYPLDEATFEDKSITDPREREKIYGQDDHVRLYGKDYPDRIRKAGFHVREDDFINSFSGEEFERYALPKDEIIYFCEKRQ